MSRDYKKFAPGTISHIYNRGNNKEKIFFEEQDYKAFLFRLTLSLGFKQEELKHELLSLPYSRIRITDSDKKNFKLHAFCLEPNHFHLLVEQVGDIPISTLILKVCTSYSKYINKKYTRVGHLVQDRFKAVLIESNSQLMWTSAYIHMNPVKDKIVKHPEDYKWSSYNDYTLDRNLPIVYRDLTMGLFEGKENFKKQTFSLASNVKGSL